MFPYSQEMILMLITSWFYVRHWGLTKLILSGIYYVYIQSSSETALKVDLVYQSHMGYNADYFNTIWLLKNILQIKNIYVKFILESVP